MNEETPAPAQSDAPSAEEFWKTWWPEQIIKRVNYKRESDLSMAFAEAYAALRTEKFERELGDAKFVEKEITAAYEAKVAQLERERDALKEEIVPLIIEVNGAKKSLPIWAGLLSKELERVKAAETRAETAESALAAQRERIEMILNWVTDDTRELCKDRLLDLSDIDRLIEVIEGKRNGYTGELTVAAQTPEEK